jgi:hypothetical protein
MRRGERRILDVVASRAERLSVLIEEVGKLAAVGLVTTETPILHRRVHVAARKLNWIMAIAAQIDFGFAQQGFVIRGVGVVAIIALAA